MFQVFLCVQNLRGYNSGAIPLLAVTSMLSQYIVYLEIMPLSNHLTLLFVSDNSRKWSHLHQWQ